MSAILLTGGTGTLGRHVTRLLSETGREVRVLSRRPPERRDGIEYVTGDLSTGAGVDAAVDGVDTILHCAGSAKGDDAKASTLVEAATRAGAPHLVYISVVGADRVPVVSAVDRAMFGYFGAKRAAEGIVTGSGLPFTILRATQFHDFVLTVLRQMAALPVMPLWSGVRFQPVDAGEVAARLVELAGGAPAGLVPDIAGPEIHGMPELARGYLRATGKHRLVVSMRTPGRAAAAFRDGANLSPDRAVGRRTWDDFLAVSAAA